MAETGRPPRPHLESEIGNSGGGFDKLAVPLSAAIRRRAPPRGHLHRNWCSTAAATRGRRSPSTSPGTAAACRSARPTSARCWARPAWPRPSTASPAPARADIPTLHPLRGPRDHAGGHGPVRRARGDHPAVRGSSSSSMPRGPSPGWAATCWAIRTRPPWPRMREAVAGTSLFSPFPFHSVYSVEDHKKHLDWIAHVNPQALLVGEGLDAHRRGHGGRGRLLRRRAHRPPGRQLRRHGGGAEHRQEEHRHADRVRDQPRPPVPGRRGHPRPDHA